MEHEFQGNALAKLGGLERSVRTRAPKRGQEVLQISAEKEDAVVSADYQSFIFNTKASMNSCN